MVKYIYGGNHSFLVLHDFLDQMARTPLRVREMHDDRFSYFLTFQQWAKNFDQNRQEVIARFGEFNYRRFRLYLWGAAYEFLSGSLDCYRMIIERPVFPGEGLVEGWRDRRAAASVGAQALANFCPIAAAP